MTWDTGSGPQPFASATDGLAGQLTSLSYGAGTETRTYNSLLQLTSQSIPGYMNMTYTYSATQNNGRITGSVDSVTGESTSYSYDALNRLTGASNGLWSASYGYDGFGNLTSKSGSGGAPAMTVTYDANNRQVGVSYDANGNPGTANGAWNGYSVENRLNTQTSMTWPQALTTYGYDPSGKRVMKRHDPDPNNWSTGSAPAWEFYFYGITGQRLVTVDCVPSGGAIPSCSIVGQNVYFGTKLLVSNGVNVVTDRLGSVRGNTQGERFSYYPYGEERTSTIDGRDKFGTYFRDGVGQDYADQRYYNAGMGRFLNADPGGIKTAKQRSPGSWNRYAYVQGDPVNHTDRHGLFLDAEDCIDNPDACIEEGSGCDSRADGFLDSPEPCPTEGGGTGDSTDPPPKPSCQQLLTTAISTFLSGRGSPLAVDAAEIVQVAKADNLDPTLIAAIAIAENGQYKNNPFSLGPNGSNTYPSLDAAISAEGQQLDKFIYTWKETTVAQLWSGNTWQVNPQKPWITIQYPGYCVGQIVWQIQGCINTGLNISSFMQSMGKQATVGGNPNNLAYPCEN